MNLKTALVLVGMNAAISATAIQAAELESGRVGKFPDQGSVYGSIAQHGPRELANEEMDRVTAGLTGVETAAIYLGLIEIAKFCTTVDCVQLVDLSINLLELSQRQIEQLEQARQEALRKYPGSQPLSKEIKQVLRQLEQPPSLPPPPDIPPPPPPEFTPTPTPTPSPPNCCGIAR